MLNFSRSGVALGKLALGLTLAAALGACGGGGDDAPAAVKVSSADAKSAVTAATVAALFSTTPIVASFAIGFSGTDNTTADNPVAVAGPTTVSFTSSSATPSFAITNGGKTATGTTTFGSCIFTVTASTFPPESPLAAGKVVKVNPCSLTASTSGANADGLPVERNVVLVLGTASSEPVRLVITINADGTVLIGTTSLGSVTLTAATGAGS
jgi:hypothetical protein